MVISLIGREEIVLLGGGTTKFGVQYNVGVYDLLIDAVMAALKDAGLQRQDIDAAWMGNAISRITANIGDSGDCLADALALGPIPVTRIVNYCSSGTEAVRAAAMAVASGECEIGLAVGFEKMRDVTPKGSMVETTVKFNHPFLTKGKTTSGQFALLARRYLHTFGYGPEVLAEVAVKNHFNSTLNPKAHFTKEVTREQVMAAPRVAEPLGLLDCTATTDGAAAAIVTTRRKAEELGRDYVVIKSIGSASWGGYYSYQYDPSNDFLGFASTREAAKKAYQQAGIEDPINELDVAECHDCFTITELVNYEDLGFCKRGEGGKLLMDGVTRKGGKLPVNLSGGLQSCGHPVGATGVRMFNEIADQLRGRAGGRQVAGAKLGLIHTLGGPGTFSCVAILERPGH